MGRASTIRVETAVRAPAPVCFDLARDVDAHVRSASGTGERVVGGRTSGLVGLGDEVTLEAVHFGVLWRITSRITRFEPPRLFVDEMVKGPFRVFRHVHEFRESGDVTLMIDDVELASPLGPLGRLADAIVVVRHLRTFLERRAAWLRDEAERRAASSRR